jgi:hypothetical protein
MAAQVRHQEAGIAGRFDASQLRLYQVDVPAVDKAIEKMKQLNLDQDVLTSLKKLNKVYASCPPDDIIHFVVLLPSDGESVKIDCAGVTPCSCDIMVLWRFATSILAAIRIHILNVTLTDNF